MADKSLSTIARELYQGFGNNPANKEFLDTITLRAPIVREFNPLVTIPRGIETLRNTDYGALKDLLLQKYQLADNPRQELQREGKALLNLGEGALDVSPLGFTAKPIAKGMKAAAPTVARQAVNLAEKYGVSPVMNVVKPEGPSNWMPGSVELTTDRLKMPPREVEPITGAKIEERGLVPIWEEMHTTRHGAYTPRQQADFLAKYYPEKLRDFGFGYSPEDQAVNTFIDKRLKKYIRNEMGTESDPVRALAERGVLHFNPDPVAEYSPNVVKNQVALRRSAAGFPAGGSAESDLARNWENLSDFTIEGNPVSKWKEEAKPEVLATMPWIEHLGPADTIWERTDPGMRSRLGLDHLVDELKNAVDPDSTLPQHLRLSNKQLEQMPMERAVEHVSKINDWRAAEAARAEQEGLKANLSASARLEDTSFNPSFAKGQGGKWVDVPETVDENGMQLCTSIGKAGGWCTQTRGMAKQEGSGENRLAVLLDVEGRPHVQATINSINVPENATGVNDVLFNRLVNEGHDPAEASQIVSRINDQDYEVFDYYNDRGIDLEQYVNDAETAVQSKNAGKQQLPSITQLKPVGNSISSSQAREYARRDPEYQSKVQQSVVNFLNSQEWGNVKNDDLRHLGIVDLNVAGQADSLPGIDSEALYLAFHNAPEDTPRFMTDKQFKDFVAPYLDTGAAFAAGGLVDYNEDDVDKMSDELLQGEYGLRVTGEPKGKGALGEIRLPDGRDVMTEYSINPQGRGEMPSIVEGMHPADLNYLREYAYKALQGEDAGEFPSGVEAVAKRSAQRRKAEGKPAFYGEGGAVKDPFADLGIMDKAKLLGKAIKYRVQYNKQAEEHGKYPDVLAAALKEKYREQVGNSRVNRSPLDAAINYGGGYDFGVRGDIPPAVARDMAKAYQYTDYFFSPFTGPKSDAIGDYYENMAGVEAGIKERGRRASEAEIQRRAAAYGRKVSEMLPQNEEENYAEGGLVYNDDEISKLADQLIGV